MATSTTDVTVVTVFSNISTAQSAANALVSNGFSIGDIYIHSGKTAAVARQADHAERYSTDSEKGLTAWFKALFGSEGNREAQRAYEEAFQSGNTILTLDTTEQDAARAADVLNRFPPINVHTEAGDASVKTIAGTSVGTRRSLVTPPSRRVSNQAGVKEDVRVKKDALERADTVRDTPRHSPPAPAEVWNKTKE
jgi:hypothetical protein